MTSRHAFLGCACVSAFTFSGCGGDQPSDGLATADLFATPASLAPATRIEAGPDKVQSERAIVELAGTVEATTGTPAIVWSVVEGPAPTFESTTNPLTRIVLPDVDRDTTIVLRLEVGDGTSAFDEVAITVTDTQRDRPFEGPEEEIAERRDYALDNREDSASDPKGREVRTFDGTGNNIGTLDMGATHANLLRLMKADYADGIAELAGAHRPSPREISNRVHAQAPGESIPNRFGTSDMLWQWGQFIDHDFGLTPGAGMAIDISVPKGDRQFDPEGTGSKVIGLTRAAIDPSTGITTPRESTNIVTAWIDGSHIYGSDIERANALREGPDSPFLATREGDLLPLNTAGLPNENGFVRDPASLFLAGDVRANEQVGLAAMHTLFVREHNRLARRLQVEYPDRSSETIFQMARRLVIAELQIVTYEEFLPALLGDDVMPPYNGYDAVQHAGVFNAFSGAAFRFGHSAVGEATLRLGPDLKPIPEGHLDLVEAFFTAPQLLSDGGSIDPILRGLAYQPHQALDVFTVDPLRNFLFGAPGAGGLDLVSLNLQRGRDKGLPSYNDAREAMGLPRAQDWSDITSDAYVADRLADAYFDVDDIDMWTGGLAEDPYKHSQLGQLFTLIVAEQFAALRDCDRFWWETDLTAEEKYWVEGVRLSDIIRANTGIGDELQDNAFYVPSGTSAKIRSSAHNG